MDGPVLRRTRFQNSEGAPLSPRSSVARRWWGSGSPCRFACRAQSRMREAPATGWTTRQRASRPSLAQTSSRGRSTERRTRSGPTGPSGKGTAARRGVAFRSRRAALSRSLRPAVCRSSGAVRRLPAPELAQARSQPVSRQILCMRVLAGGYLAYIRH